MACLFAELVRLSYPADEKLHQRLGNAGVDTVVGHVVAHPVGAPAQRELAEIARSQHQRLVKVGEPEKMAGALSRLNILEGYVVDRFSFRVGMIDIAQHLLAARANV